MLLSQMQQGGKGGRKGSTVIGMLESLMYADDDYYCFDAFRVPFGANKNMKNDDKNLFCNKIPLTHR